MQTVYEQEASLAACVDGELAPVEEETEDVVGKDGGQGRQETTERSRSDSEVGHCIGTCERLGEGSLPDHGQEQSNLATADELPYGEELALDAAFEVQDHRGAIGSLNFLWTAQEHGDDGTDGLQGNEYAIGLDADASLFTFLGVESEIDGTANELTQHSVRQPVGNVPTKTVSFRVREDDGSFRAPEESC